jgi:hypothetical protein
MIRNTANGEVKDYPHERLYKNADRKRIAEEKEKEKKDTEALIRELGFREYAKSFQ